MTEDERTRQVGRDAPSGFDVEKTELVDQGQIFPHGAPRSAASADDGEKTTLVNNQPSAAVPPPAASPAPPQGFRAPPAPPQPAPYYPPPAGAAPYPGNPASAPPPPPAAGPAAPQSYPPYPPAPGALPPYGQTQPGPGATPPPPPGFGATPPPPQSPKDAANALLAKGNSFISRLMMRGIRGELIRAPWFQSFRHHNPDQFVYVGYGIGVLLAIVFGLLPGIAGSVASLAVWAVLAYLFFAIGTLKAHQFIAYGICGVGVTLCALSALFAVTTFIDLSSLHLAGTALILLISLVVTVITGAILAWVGISVHRGIKELKEQ